MSLALLYPALLEAAEWTFARSSGPGGQNVNKVNSKAVLRVSLDRLELLSDVQKDRLREKLAGRIVEGALVVHVQDTRSQLENRELALHRLEGLIRVALAPVRPRHATKPTRASRERRLTGKKSRSETKANRRSTSWD